MPPVQLVKALFAGQRIYLNTGHRHLKRTCQLENMQLPSHATFAKKDNLPIKTDTQERESSRDIPSLKKVSTINIIPTKKSELLVPFVSQAKDLHKPGI